MRAGIARNYRRNYGLLLWQAGFDGAFDFSYNCGFDDPWNDVDHGVWKDHLMVYPTGTGVVDTIQWEGWRTGVDDCRYLSTLLFEIDQTRKAGRTAAADVATKWIGQLKEGGPSALQDLDTIRQKMVGYIRACRIAGLH